jgi:hypothetical protein
LLLAIEKPVVQTDLQSNVCL